MPPPCLLLSRRVARREEEVLALSGVLQIRSTTVMLPAVSPCRRERGRGVNFVSANAFAVGGRVQALATACWSYLVQTGSAAVVLPVVSPCRRERGSFVSANSACCATTCWSPESRRFAGRRGEVLASSVPMRSLWVGECKLLLLLAGLTCC